MCNKKWGLIKGGVIRKCARLEKIHKDLTLKSDLFGDVNFNLDGYGPVGKGSSKIQPSFADVNYRLVPYLLTTHVHIIKN